MTSKEELSPPLTAIYKHDSLYNFCKTSTICEEKTSKRGEDNSTENKSQTFRSNNNPQSRRIVLFTPGQRAIRVQDTLPIGYWDTRILANKIFYLFPP